MSTVGGFPGININRMTIKAPINPLDKASVISIYPRPIHEVKHTIEPGIFNIPPGTYENPGILVVGPSSWWKETDEGQPLLEIPHSSLQIAHSIVRDYLVSVLACDMGEFRPGLFYIPGVVTAKELRDKKEYFALLEQARVRQKKWYEALVKMADILWARTNGNPLTISDDMKLAAQELNLNTKAWIKDFQHIQMVNCPACGTLKNPLYPVCPNCKAVTDKEAAAKLGITFASQSGG